MATRAVSGPVTLTSDQPAGEAISVPAGSLGLIAELGNVIGMSKSGITSTQDMLGMIIDLDDITILDAFGSLGYFKFEAGAYEKKFDLEDLTAGENKFNFPSPITAETEITLSIFIHNAVLSIAKITVSSTTV